mgnify:CR=1 FL=1
MATASPIRIGPLATASRSISSPPARLIAPATPPPIHRWVFAAFTTASGVDIGHLTQLPRTRAAVATLARNVDRVRRHFDVPLLLENVAWTWRWPDDEMDEAAFYAEVVAARQRVAALNHASAASSDFISKCF